MAMSSLGLEKERESKVDNLTDKKNFDVTKRGRANGTLRLCLAFEVEFGEKRLELMWLSQSFPTQDDIGVHEGQGVP